MGVYNSVTISTGLNERITSLINYLNNLGDISAEASTETYSEVEYTGATFQISGAGISGFFGYSEAMKSTLVWLKNGEVDIIANTVRGSNSGTAGDLTIHSYIDDNLKIITLYDSHSDPGGIEVVLLNDTYILVGYKALTTAAFADISALVFEDVTDTARIQYTYTNMFPYSAAPGMLDFLAQAYFVNNGTRHFMTDILKECSTVTLLSTVSLPSPLNNHLAIGTHCVVPLTEGGNE